MKTAFKHQFADNLGKVKLDSSKYKVATLI